MADAADRIARVETFVLKLPPVGGTYWGKASWDHGKKATHRPLSAEYPPPARRRYVYSDTIDCCIVRIETRGGAVGWGEAKAPVGADATARIIDDLLAPIVLDADPLEIRVLWERMFGAMRVRGHSNGFWLEAISGIDIALWDLAGNLLGQPIYKLLGGAFREKLRVYASGLPALYDGTDDAALDQLVERARDITAKGFRGLKMALGKGIEPDRKAVEAVRAALPADADLFVDAAGVYEPQQAIRLGRYLNELNVGWFEMPIPTDNLPGYIQVATALDVPIALDALANRGQARDYVAGGGLDVIQPDVCRAGGITESLKMAEVADLYGAACAPHVSIGSAIQFAASVHLAASLPNQNLMEFWYGGNPLGESLQKTPFRIEDGYFWVPETPGLGADVDETALRKWAV